jgi:hypothetical protein
MKKLWKWKVTITLSVGGEVLTETVAESIKKATESLSYVAKRLNGEITCVSRADPYENENQGCQSD